MFFFIQMLDCPAGHVFPLPDHKNITFTSSLKWEWKEKWINSAHIVDSLNFCLDTAFVCSCALHRGAALQFSLIVNLGNKSLFSAGQWQGGSCVCVCDTRSACFGNHTHPHNLSSHCLIDRKPDTLTYINCLYFLSCLTRWGAEFIINICVCVGVWVCACMHHLALWRLHHLTYPLIPELWNDFPATLNTLCYTW